MWDGGLEPGLESYPCHVGLPVELDRLSCRFSLSGQSNDDGWTHVFSPWDGEETTNEPANQSRAGSFRSFLLLGPAGEPG